MCNITSKKKILIKPVDDNFIFVFCRSSSRTDLVQLKPIYDDAQSECSSKVVVTPISRDKRRYTAIVLAEHQTSDEVLRCDVILDVIDQLGVLTTTHELYLEEAPETFELLAHDSQGNAFSTLEGIEFNWQIVTTTEMQVLKFLTFSESVYHEVPRSVAKFESLGLKGYMVLMEGINTGSAKVVARLPYPEYAHVAAVEVDITVLANIILDPVDAHILVGDSIAFRILQVIFFIIHLLSLRAFSNQIFFFFVLLYLQCLSTQLKQGKLYEITETASQYYFEIENTEYATVTGNVAHGSALGRTNVILRDRNVADWDVSSSSSSDAATAKQQAPRASLTVTQASKIKLRLMPDNNWSTISGRRHDIAIDLYTKDDNRILLGAAHRIDSTFDEKTFYPIERCQNGSLIHGEAIRVGNTPVHATFEQLSAKADLQVFQPLELTPQTVLLPFDPNNPKRQKIQFTATGADGAYTWTSLSARLVTISGTGMADSRLDQLNALDYSSAAKAPTQFAQIKVAMSRNPHITKVADLHFLPPHKLEIVSYNFETALGEYVEVHIALYALRDGAAQPFTACENLHFAIDFSAELFYIEAKATAAEWPLLRGSACRLLLLKATTCGSTQLRVSYTFGDRVLADEISLSVFKKLTILNPQTNEVVLPVGGARNLIYQHGPERMFNIAADLTRNRKFDRSIIEVSEVANVEKGHHVFNVLCKRIGDTELSLEMFNSLSTSTAANYVPYLSKWVTQIACVKPRFIQLYTTEKLRESCPMKAKTSLMHVKRTDDHLEVGIEVLDAQHRRLMNISSLSLDWQFVQVNGGSAAAAVSHERRAEVEQVAGVDVPVRDYLLSAVPDIQSSYKIKGTVVRYDALVLKTLGLTGEKPEFGVRKSANSDVLVTPLIENELSFFAVNRTLLPYDSISIYLGAKLPQRVQIAQGSGYYEVQKSEPDVVSVELDGATKQLIITPLRVGQV